MKYDLHIHSNVSDGKLSREEKIKKAIELKLEYISFAEHNNFEILQKNNNDKITFINCIEFDTKDDVSFHTLCYFLSINKDIENLILKYRENINKSSYKLLKNIKDIYNIDVNLKKLQQFSLKEFVTKRDIIDWLIYNGYAKTVNDAANTFTNKNSKSYYPKYSLDFSEVADVINSSGGYVFLAHPISVKNNLEAIIKKLIPKGLNGIETTNTAKMSDEFSEYCKVIANKYELLECGGSDFHDNNDFLGINNDDSKELIKLLKSKT